MGKTNIRSTPNGYNVAEVKSALQKCVRLGLEYEAFWWAHELITNNMATALWRRLTVIACEDIGAGNPMAVSIVNACREAWMDFCDGQDDPEWSVLAHAIIQLCRSPKSRTADDLAHLVWLRKSGRDPVTRQPDPEARPERLEIPERALDMHVGLRGHERINRIAVENNEDADSVATRLFREEGARVNDPHIDVDQFGTNWTEEVCKISGCDPEIALAPVNPAEPD